MKRIAMAGFAAATLAALALPVVALSDLDRKGSGSQVSQSFTSSSEAMPENTMGYWSDSSKVNSRFSETFYEGENPTGH